MKVHTFFLKEGNEISKKLSRGVIFEKTCEGKQKWRRDKIQKS